MTDSLVILDRDGVINHDSDDYIKSLDEWIPIEGSIAAIAQLSQAGYMVTVATNQSGLARGLFDEYTLAHMHSTLCELVEKEGGSINGIFFCPHLPDANCQCRKPATGMVDMIETELSVNASGAWFVGDSEKDIDLALAKGCHPLLVLTGKGVLTREKMNKDKLSKVQVFDDLFSAAMYILSHQHE